MQTVSREMRGRQILEKQGQIERLSQNTYRVSSQSGHGFYKVRYTEQRWECSCPDHTNRSVNCKHIFACKFSLAIRTEVQAQREENPLAIAPVSVSSCRFCGSERIVHDGVRHNKAGDIQVYSCRDCNRYFSFNLGFEKMKASPQAITGAMQLYFSGESLRNVQKFLALQGVKISHVGIYKWIGKYVRLMEGYLDKMKPKLGETWRADELYLKVKGNLKYLYALMDDETRFWIAQQVADTKATADIRTLFAEGRRVAGRNPRTLITDGAHNFQDACNKEFWTQRKETRTLHISKIRWKEGPTNNKMERLNGEIRDREKVMRGVKREDSPILKGYAIFHNYLRPHMALDGRTPAEACGISVLGPNKWITLIQNANRSTRAS